MPFKISLLEYPFILDFYGPVHSILVLIYISKMCKLSRILNILIGIILE